MARCPVLQCGSCVASGRGRPLPLANYRQQRPHDHQRPVSAFLCWTKAETSNDATYILPADEEIVWRSFRAKTSLTVTGLTTGGNIETVTGRLHAIQAGQTVSEGYPVRVTLVPGSGNTLVAANSNKRATN
jgi:hypothetical protein